MIEWIKVVSILLLIPTLTLLGLIAVYIMVNLLVKIPLTIPCFLSRWIEYLNSNEYRNKCKDKNDYIDSTHVILVNNDYRMSGIKKAVQRFLIFWLPFRKVVRDKNCINSLAHSHKESSSKSRDRR